MLILSTYSLPCLLAWSLRKRGKLIFGAASFKLGLLWPTSTLTCLGKAPTTIGWTSAYRDTSVKADEKRRAEGSHKHVSMFLCPAQIQWPPHKPPGKLIFGAASFKLGLLWPTSTLTCLGKAPTTIGWTSAYRDTSVKADEKRRAEGSHKHIYIRIHICVIYILMCKYARMYVYIHI